MTILALDSSTEILSVWFGRTTEPETEGSGLVLDTGLRHGSQLMPLVDEVLRSHGAALTDVDLVASSGGPGSFMGLRIGVSTAKGLAEALAARRRLQRPPLVLVPTLESIVSASNEDGFLLPVIDARKQRYYGALFLDGTRVTPDADLSPTELYADATTHTNGAPIILTGPHAQMFYRDVVGEEALSAGSAALSVSADSRSGYARGVWRRAEKLYHTEGPAPRDCGPTYIRASDAEISKRTRQQP